MPAATPKNTAKASASAASESVTGRRSIRAAVTERLSRID